MNAKHNILESARDLFLDEGPGSFSMRKVAQRAGISATAIYRHYKDKEDLHHQLIRHGFQAYMSSLLPALKGESAKERFDLNVKATFDFVMAQPRYYQLIFLSADTNEQLANNPDLRKESKASFNFLTDRIRECMQAGIFKEDNPSECCVMWLASCNGFFSLYFSGLLPRSEKELKMLYFNTVDRMLNGLLVS